MRGAPIASAIRVSAPDLQVWASGAKRAFMEVFAGGVALLIALSCGGLEVSEGIDRFTDLVR